MAYQSNPSPQSGVMGPYGLIPGPISLPDPYGDLNTAIGGNLGGINSQLFGNLMSEAQGQIPIADQKFMQDQQAGKAIASGMPGSNAIPGTLGGNRSARDYGLTQMQLQAQAAQQYPGLVGSVSNTQTVSPALQATIAGTNASNAALANPTIAGNYAQQLFDQYMQNARGPGGGTGNQTDPIQQMQQNSNNITSQYENQLNQLLNHLYGGSTTTGTTAAHGATGDITMGNPYFDWTDPTNSISSDSNPYSDFAPASDF